MWQESLIESRRGKTGRTKLLTFLAAVLLHGLLMAATMVSSYTFVRPVTPPPIRITFFSAPPPISFAGSSVRQVVKKQPAQPKEVAAFVQPLEVPVDILEPADPSNTTESLEPALEEDVDYVSFDEGTLEGGYPVGLVPGIPDGIVPLPASGMGEAAPLRLTAEMRRPQKIRMVNPDYPSEAQRAHIQGIVVLKAIINERGFVEDIVVVQSLHPLLDRNAMDAIREWRYRPAYLQKKPVRVYLTVVVKFSLDYRGGAELW